MGLFSQDKIDQIKQVAEKSNQVFAPPTTSTKVKGLNDELHRISQAVEEYFKDSEAILITSKEQLHDYVSKLIEVKYAGIDTETTGLDRVKDTIVGASLYYPGGVECYIPMKHIVPIFDEPYKGQLSYQDVGEEFQRIADSDVRLIFANADFDLAMMYKDLNVDFCDSAYYDVILAWRCLKENEKDNTLKGLYNKYVLKGKGDPKKFSDFFSVKLFPYCKPQVAKLYAANDAKITYELFRWQLPYLTPTNPKCQKSSLERIASLFWDVEMPLVKICQNMHRTGIYLDKAISDKLLSKYQKQLDDEKAELALMVQDIIDKSDYVVSSKRPFKTGKDFNPSSTVHAKYLIYTMLRIPEGRSGGTGKEVLTDLNLPVTNQILKVRSTSVLMNTFVKKMPNATTSDSRIHAQFKQIGADCVVGNTLIATPSGYVQIQDLEKFEESGRYIEYKGQIINRYQDKEATESVVMYKDFETIRVVTEHGFVIEGTHNHPILVHPEYEVHVDADMYGWFCKLTDIQIGDNIIIPTSYSDVVNTDTSGFSLVEYDQVDLMTLCGMFSIYGYVSRWFESIHIPEISSDSVQEVQSLMLRLFPDSVCTANESKSLGKFTVKAASKSFTSEIDKFLNEDMLSDDSELLRLPVDMINKFIFGLTVYLVADYDKDRYWITFPVPDVPILGRMIHQHLASQGIVGSYRPSSRWSYGGHDIFLVGDMATKFIDKIGVFPSKYSDFCIEQLNKHLDHLHYDDVFIDKVYNIYRDNGCVYDFVVPGSHSFISNGIISHNTGRMCIAKGSKVITPKGNICIEDVQPGDIVYAQNIEDNHIERGVVKNTWKTGVDKECLELTFHGEDDTREYTLSLKCTPEHKILIEDENSMRWIEARSLCKYDKVKSFYDVTFYVDSVRSCDNSDVYDLEIENYHNFFVEGICVHNSSAEPNVQNIPSHAEDIRHMFRATAARKHLETCNVTQEGEINIVLDTICSVDVDNNEQKKVENLEVGDIVIFKNDTKIRKCEIIRIEEKDIRHRHIYCKPV